MGDWVDSFGLAALFLIVALQAAGVPGPPGKTALVIAALLAADGRLVLWQVLVVAALAITAGGMIGYAIGHRGGRPLLERWWPRSKLDRLLSAAERFFERHGGKWSSSHVFSLASRSRSHRWPESHGCDCANSSSASPRRDRVRSCIRPAWLLRRRGGGQPRRTIRCLRRARACSTRARRCTDLLARTSPTSAGIASAAAVRTSWLLPTLTPFGSARPKGA